MESKALIWPKFITSFPSVIINVPHKAIFNLGPSGHIYDTNIDRGRLYKRSKFTNSCNMI